MATGGKLEMEIDYEVNLVSLIELNGSKKTYPKRFTYFQFLPPEAPAQEVRE